MSKVVEPNKKTPEAHTPQPDAAEYLYDATLIQLDTLRGSLVFKVGEVTHRITYPHVSSFSVGAIGRLRLPTPEHEFSFNTYPDQRLRRTPDLDQPLERRWGWRIGERKFTVEAGIIPGRAGKVIRRDTRPVALEIPAEFDRLCRSRGLVSERVLGTFIADACALTNFYGAPREDGYCASGEDSHRLALDYIDRAWGEEGTSQRGPRRAGKEGSRNPSG